LNGNNGAAGHVHAVAAAAAWLLLSILKQKKIISLYLGI
jgi:hypothetical protein